MSARRSTAQLVVAASLSLAALAQVAAGAVVYSDNFNSGATNGTPGSATGGTFTINTTITQQTPGDSAAFVNDQSAATRGVVGFRYSAGNGPTGPVMTLSFDIEGTVATTGGGLSMRIDNLTANNIGSAAQFIVGSNSLTGDLAPGSATADKTLFFIYNQAPSGDSSYTNPVDNQPVTLEAGTLDYYIRNNETGAITQLVVNKVLVDQNGATEGFGETVRFAFGNTGNTDTATYQLDDIVLETGYNALFAPIPEPASIGILGCGAMLLVARRRRRLA